jgi:hypothetical protein
MARYLAELERVWWENRKTKKLGSLLKLFDSPDFKRPKTLRGRDLVEELIRLAAMTGDARFRTALIALFEHRIVGPNYNFLPWEMASVAEQIDKIEQQSCFTIHMLKSGGMSLRRACAEFAAYHGWPATSFAAAMKHLELVGREEPDFRRI